MFKYVPVLRYRQEESRALKNTPLTNNTLPLLEIVMEKPSDIRKSEKSFSKDYSRDLLKINSKIPLLIDFPIYMTINNSTHPEVRNFLLPMKQNPSKRLNRFAEILSSRSNLIPTASYDPNNFNIKIFEDEIFKLAKSRPKIAYRIFLEKFSEAWPIVLKYIRKNDILILDIDEAPHQNTAVKDKFDKVNAAKSSKRFISVIVRSAIPSITTNIGLPHNSPLTDADNSLLKDYHKLGFDAFGDFASIKKDKTITKSEGAKHSTGFIFYVWKDNYYVGFKGRFEGLAEFEDYIAPAVINSFYWKSYNSMHHKHCSCCASIYKIANGKEPGKSLAKWKGLSIRHYLHTMEEFL